MLHVFIVMACWFSALYLFVKKNVDKREFVCLLVLGVVPMLNLIILVLNVAVVYELFIMGRRKSIV